MCPQCSYRCHISHYLETKILTWWHQRLRYFWKEYISLINQFSKNFYRQLLLSCTVCWNLSTFLVPTRYFITWKKSMEVLDLSYKTHVTIFFSQQSILNFRPQLNRKTISHFYKTNHLNFLSRYHLRFKSIFVLIVRNN